MTRDISSFEKALMYTERNRYSYLLCTMKVSWRGFLRIPPKLYVSVITENKNFPNTLGEKRLQFIWFNT